MGPSPHCLSKACSGQLIVLMERCVCVLSCFRYVWFFATLWTVACQASLSMGFSSQDYCSGLSFPPPGDLSNPGIKPASFTYPAFQAGSLPLVPPGKPNWNVVWLFFSPTLFAQHPIYDAYWEGSQEWNGSPEVFHSLGSLQPLDLLFCCISVPMTIIRPGEFRSRNKRK